MALSAGSIAFTGFNGDGNDNLSFVALTDIAQGTVINFTDSNWNGSSFASGSSAESTMAWTATSAISAGTVIDINNIGSGTLGASAGTVTFTNANNTGLSNDSEVVYAYVGSASAPTFLAAISNVGYSTSDGTLTGTGLVAGQTAVSFTGGLDIVGYNGARSGQTSFAAYLAAINNPANWVTQNGSGNQSADGTAPDAPFPTTAFTVSAPASQTISFSPSSVSVAEGDSGTKTLTFTIVRSGGTTGALSFSGTFAAGTTDAADYGGTLPAPTFSGTIAAGANSATVTITISGDTTGEGDESFTLTLTSATNPSASVTIGTANATGTITNDDGIVVSSNSSTAITLANNDHATILSGVTLSGSTPVTWVGGSTSPGALLDNFGTVTGTSRAIYTSGSNGGSFTVHNEAGATITAVKDAIKISNLVAGTSGTFTVNNEGTISSTGVAGNAGQALDLDDIASANVHTLINNAASGVIQAADADAIRGGTNATINNYGHIVSHNGSASSTGNDAIDFQSVNTGGVVNNFAGGVIDGARHGITGDQPITVNNAGTITGEAGSGINMDTAGTTTTVVNNAATGTIAGTAVNGADADGVDVDGLVAIDNFGTIQAVGLTSAANGLNEALAIGGGTVHNEAGGKIISDQRAITVDDSNDGSAFAATTIINDGTIQGGNGEAISITGGFADTLTNTGTITGSVDMGGGDDTINLVAGSIVTGTIDGGAGSDTLNLSGAGNGALGRVTNVETLDVQSGVWAIADAAGFSDVTVESGALLIAWGQGSATTVAQGGAHYVYGSASGSTVFGEQIIGAGGAASDTQIEFGGEQVIADGGTSSGATIDGGNQFVYGTADQTTIGADGLQYVYGSATNTTVDSGGQQNIYTAGSANGTTLNAGATQIDWGTAVDTTIDGGDQYVLGTASDTTITSGVQYVASGGVASTTTIDGGGEQHVDAGATASGTTIDGGSQFVYGAADQTTIDAAGLQHVYGSATGTAVNSGGEQNVYATGTATGTTLNAGGFQINWGTAIDTTINGGSQYVYGTANNTTVSSGGLYVMAGGTANGATIGSGGIEHAAAGASVHDVTFAGPDATLVLDERISRCRRTATAAA
jgi:autotransporter passenger strand-loop-strand repeat protein